MSWLSRIFKSKPKKKILFVCTGNTCRSPMAEGLMRKALGKKAKDYVVESAGVSANEEPASTHAISVMKNRGIDISKHMSRKLTPELIRSADLIFTMSPSHLREVKRLVPEAKAFLLRDGGVSDPYGGDEKRYQSAADDIDSAIGDRIKNLDSL